MNKQELNQIRKVTIFEFGYKANKPIYSIDKVPVSFHIEDDLYGEIIEGIRFYSPKLSSLQIYQCLVKIGRNHFKHENFTVIRFVGRTISYNQYLEETI